MSCECPMCGNELCDNIVLRPEAGLLLWPTGYVRLSRSECTLLETLMKSHPKRVRREDLIMALYVQCHHKDDPPNEQSVRVHMCHLRRKLDAAGAPLSIPRVRSYAGGYYVVIKEERERKAA